MLTMVHANGVRIERGMLQVDRKFLTGMRRYVENIDAPLLTIHPLLLPGSDQAMDTVEVPCNELGFEVMAVDARNAADVARMRQRIRTSELVVGGDLGADVMAKSSGVPYILVLEYDLRTQMTVTSSQVGGGLRQLVRRARCAAQYFSKSVPAMRAATALHCNGFPVYDEAERYNANRLLYLDSRMSADMLIPASQLDERLAARSGRTVRLLYSGRYEPMKGAVDSVLVALECLRRGLNIEMHCYGQGNQLDSMRSLAAQASVPGRIQIHEAIPYPELVDRSREFDAFVCCHIQSDPSCTYLESFGAGLPIVGYGNRMWERLCEVSGCGRSSPIGRPEAVADSVAWLLSNDAEFNAMSLRAREFASAHTFDREFLLRTRAIGQTLAALQPRAASAQMAA